MSETIALLPVLVVWLGMALFVALGGGIKTHNK